MVELSTPPRWPSEAHPWPDEAMAYRQRVAERVFAQLKDADWRHSTVERAYDILEKMVVAGLVKGDVNSVAQALRQANLAPSLDLSDRPDDDLANHLTFDSIIGEAAGLLLYRRTRRDAWTLATGLWSHFNNMLKAFQAFLEEKYESDDEFRDRLDDVADIVFQEAADRRVVGEEPGSSNVGSLAERWREAPNLRDVWSGLHWVRHTFGPSEVSILAHVYIALNRAAFAAFLDRFDNPYQVWDILTGWAHLGLDRTFAVWAELFSHAQASFKEDGSWTKRTLEPLLLVIAENALKEARLPKEAADDLVLERGEEFGVLTKQISEIIAQKPGGAPLALRWSAQLFRYSAGGSDEEPYPKDLRQGTTTLWRMLEALGRSNAASSWNRIAVPDAMPEEVLCLLAAKVVAADERKSELPDMGPLLNCCPDGPENFLGVDAIAKRAVTQPFSMYNTRPDALKFRIFGLLFFQGDPVDSYRNLWKRTLTLRELAEHWQTDEQQDGRTDAKQVLAMILAIGLNVVDLYVDTRSASTANVQRNSEQFGQLFKVVYDSLREVQAIELFNQASWFNLFTHLLVRRVVYENSRIGDFELTAPLSPTMRPTLSEMLVDAAGIRQPFFLALDNLVRNGLAVERIADALNLGGVNLRSLIDAAKCLNEIDDRRPYRLEAAERIAATMEGDA